MSEATTTIGGAGRTLRTLACIVVVAAGLKAAESVLLPIVAAAFLALVALPAQARLVRWGLPKGLAVGLTLLGALLALGAFTSLLAASVNTFTHDLPQMRKEFDTLIGGLVGDLNDWGWASAGEGLQGRFNPSALLDLVTTTTRSLLDLLSSFVVILLLTIFALVEADDFAPKLRFALGKPDADLSLYVRMARGVSTYAFWKTVMNALTGAMVALLCVLIGLRNPLLWGLIAFLFNFVPSVGSLIVAVPIVLLTLAERGSGPAVVMGVAYLAVNQAIGSVLEPLFMGRRMGLSPLVILISLLIWGWIWGPVGMLLSVPLTMIVRSLLLESRDGRALGVLLGPSPEPVVPPGA